MAETIQLRTRISAAHRRALENIENLESLPTNTVVSNLIFNHARGLGVWPIEFERGEDDREATDHINVQ